MTTNSPLRWKFSTAALAIVLTLVLMPAPTHGASDNTNLIQQILVMVQNIQTILTGTDVGVSSLQSDVTAIKAKTDNLPSDTATALAEIKAAVGGYGPLNRTLMYSLGLADGNSATIACTSPGPFLLHIHGEGNNASVLTQPTIGTALYFQNVNREKSAYMVFGGDPNEIINVHAETQIDVAASIQLHITMQYVDGQIASCNSVGT